MSCAVDREGVWWRGTSEGMVWQLRAGKWLAQTNFASAVTAIAPAPDDSIWFGTQGSGLYRFRNGSFSHVEKSEGPKIEDIRTLYLDAHDTLWIGTAGGG